MADRTRFLLLDRYYAERRGLLRHHFLGTETDAHRSRRAELERHIDRLELQEMERENAGHSEEQPAYKL